MSIFQSLAQCVNPLATAHVFNPTRPEYYLATATPAAAPAAPAPDPAVRVTLSSEAQAALSGE